MRSIARLLVGLALAASGASAFVGDTDPAPSTDTAVLTTSGDADVNEIALEASPSPTPTTGGRAFAAAKKTWISCVQDAHELHKEGAAARREAGAEATAFDREASCGEKPHPRGFGLASSKVRESDDATPTVADPSDDDGDDSGDRRNRGKGHKGGHTKHAEDEGDDD